MAYTLYHNDKNLVIINVYRIPAISLNGNKCSLIQYNLHDRKTKTPTQYQKEIFKQIKEFLSSNIDITDIIIGGNLNQHIASREVQHFLNEISI